MMLLFNECHPNLLKKYKMIFNHGELLLSYLACFDYEAKGKNYRAIRVKGRM